MMGGPATGSRQAKPAYQGQRSYDRTDAAPNKSIASQKFDALFGGPAPASEPAAEE